VTRSNHPSENKDELTRVAAARDRAKNRLMKLANVNGVGVGLKRKSDKLTSQLCVRAYVSRKLPRDQLEAGDVIPSEVDGVSTDVIEIDPKFLRCDPEGSAPNVARGSSIEGGKSIGLLDVPGIGTLGMAVFDVETHRDMLLSNAHVLSNGGLVRGTPVTQPAGRAKTADVNDGGTAADVVGRVERGIWDEELDAAVAHVSGHRFLEKSVLGIGVVRGAVAPAIGMEIRKSGRSTGVTAGVITEIDAELDIDDPSTGRTWRMRGLILAEGDEIIACPGDSGCVMLDNNHRAVALLFGGSEESNHAIACRMDLVLERLGIRLDRGVDMQTIIASTTTLFH